MLRFARCVLPGAPRVSPIRVYLSGIYRCCRGSHQTPGMALPIYRASSCGTGTGEQRSSVRGALGFATRHNRVARLATADLIRTVSGDIRYRHFLWVPNATPFFQVHCAVITNGCISCVHSASPFYGMHFCVVILTLHLSLWRLEQPAPCLCARRRHSIPQNSFWHRGATPPCLSRCLALRARTRIFAIECI